jgi:hypothetical protein
MMQGIQIIHLKILHVKRTKNHFESASTFF